MSLSNVTIIGNLGRDPETRYTPNGRMNVNFSVATNRRWTDQSGQQQERTTWFNCTAWGSLAELLDRFAQQGSLRKGSQVFVQGRLDTREYQGQDGQTRTSLDVNVTEFHFMGGRADAEGGTSGRRDYSDSPGSDPGGYEPQDIDDIPF